MDINVFPTPKKTAQASAEFICDFVKKYPNAVITYATGNTQIPIYKNIFQKVKAGGVDFSQTYAFHLDEYYPCRPNEPHSFVGYLRKFVFKSFGIDKENIFEINGVAAKPQDEVDRIRKLIQKRPPDLVILGIGPGGHIAFNEVGSKKDSRFRLVDLSKETIHRDQVERDQSTPVQAFTWGIADILEGKNIILNAYAKKNSGYIKEVLTGKVGPHCPASYLRLARGKVNIFLDEEANLRSFSKITSNMLH